MKADNSFETTGHNRIIRITGIKRKRGEQYWPDLPTLTIQIGYTDDDSEGSQVEKAVVLDNVIIPAIVKALNGGKRTRKKGTK
jgi:hypothetical protein